MFTMPSPSACKISKKPMIPFLATSPKLVFTLSLKSVKLDKQKNIKIPKYSEKIDVKYMKEVTDK